MKEPYERRQRSISGPFSLLNAIHKSIEQVMMMKFQLTISFNMILSCGVSQLNQQLQCRGGGVALLFNV